MRRVPFQSSRLARIVAAGAALTAEGAAIATSKATYAPIGLLPKKVCGLVVCTNDFIDLAVTADDAATAIADALRDAVARALDSAFASTAAATSAKPAGILASASTVASTGITQAAIVTDLAAMIAIPTAAGIPLATGAWLVSDKGRTNLHLLRMIDDNGRLAGLPVVSSGQMSGLSLIVGGHVMLAMSDVVGITASNQGDVAMADNPAGSSTAPTASDLTNLFQTDSTALRATVWVDWQPTGPVDGSNKYKSIISLTSPSWA